MTRVSVIAAVLATGCAQAGNGIAQDAPNNTIDAFVKKDAAVTIDTPPADLCTTTDTCQTAMVLGSISGDTGAQQLTASGFKQGWLRVRVTEDDSGFPGVPLSLAIRLTSPANVNFDLFAYVNPGSDVIECSNTLGMVTHTGVTTPQWGEGGIPNGSNDDRNVTIEIRPTAGANCSAAAMWQVEITGNQ